MSQTAWSPWPGLHGALPHRPHHGLQPLQGHLLLLGVPHLAGLLLRLRRLRSRGQAPLCRLGGFRCADGPHPCSRSQWPTRDTPRTFRARTWRRCRSLSASPRLTRATGTRRIPIPSRSSATCRFPVALPTSRSPAFGKCGCEWV